MDPLPYNITISSQTASILYDPQRDGALTNGWNVTYSSGLKDTGFGFPQGVGTDSHMTERDSSSLELTWVGTAVYLYGQASSASYTVEVDGTSFTSSSVTVQPGGLLGSKTDLSYGNHTVKLTTHGSNAVAFQSAELTIGMGYNGSRCVRCQHAC